MKPVGIVALVMLAWMAVCAASVSAGARNPAGHDAAIARLAREHPRTAIAAAIIRDGKVIWTGAAGAQTEKEPATRETLFNIASLTKPVTAEVVLRLIAAGRIGLDEPIASVWMDPDLSDDPRSRILTPRLALSHQTGLPNWRPQNRRLAFARDPSSGVTYSGEGYQLVAQFVSRKLRIGFEELADQYLFGPSALRRTAYSWRPWMEGSVAVPSNADGYPGSAGPHLLGHWNAADDLYVSIGDYAAFVADVASGKGLGADLAEERLRPQIASEGCPRPVPGCPDSVGMALGWQVMTFGTRRLAVHEGGDPGVTTLAYFDPDRRDGVVIFLSGEGGIDLLMQVVEEVDPQSLVLRGYRAQVQAGRP